MIKALNKNLIQIGTKCKTKQEILKEISVLVAKQTAKLSENEIFTGLIEREKLSSTGLTQGLAIPHCMFGSLDKFFVGLIILDKGIDFESLDGEETNLIFFSIGPKDQQNQHISTLTSISKIAKDNSLLQKIMASATVDDVYKTLHREEEDSTESCVKCQFVLHIQDEKIFQDVLEILAADVEGSISVIEAQTAGYYLHKMPLFSSFWNDVSDSFSRMIIAIIDKRLMNETIRRINMIKPENNTGLLFTVNELLYFDGSLEY